MNSVDRRIFAAFMIFIMGVVVSIAQGKKATEDLTEPRLKLEKWLREWGHL